MPSRSDNVPLFIPPFPLTTLRHFTDPGLAATHRTSPNSKRNLKPSSTSASSAQPSFPTALSALQGLSQPIDQSRPYAAPAPQSSFASTNPRKRRASGQPNTQMTPSPIAPAPVPTSSAFAESSGHPAPTQESGQQPPAKKSRTNTPWTPAEELRLKHMRDAGKSWSEIAKSAALLAAIKEYEANKWKAIGAKVGKPAKACEQYAKENFGGKM
ncbi:myb dna-binding domain [Venturia nashicola]|uniref:Myb dna-binding domain n=1 Tax=Venturia nashicola TaxID=86259 RepID=A0A4Z1NU99_9PEZI|nr:myb dna-binding domain [Venturia nashicola]